MLPFKIAYSLLFALLGFLPWLLLYQTIFYPEANWGLWKFIFVCPIEIAVIALLHVIVLARRDLLD